MIKCLNQARHNFYSSNSLEVLSSIAAKRVLLFASSLTKETKAFSIALNYLKKAKIDYEIFMNNDIVADYPSCLEAVKVLQEYNPDWIIAFEEASISQAKVSWLKYERPELSFDELSKLSSAKLRLRQKCHFIAVSSFSLFSNTSIAIITDSQRTSLFPIISPEFVPDIFINDISLSYELDKDYIFSILYQSFSNAFESCLSKNSSFYTNALCYEALRIYKDNLVPFYYGNEDVRESLQEASFLVSSAVSNSLLGLTRALVDKIVYVFNKEQNLNILNLNASLLPSTLKYNSQQINEKQLYSFAKLADSLDIKTRTCSFTASKVFSFIKDLNDKLSLPSKLSDLLSKETLSSRNLTIALNASSDPFVLTNPKDLSLEEISAFLESS